MERDQQVLKRTIARAARGLTLLEMTFSMGVFSVVMLTLYGFMVTQGMVSMQESSEQKTQHDTCAGVEQLVAQLETCKLHRIDSMGAWVQYSLPRVDPSTGSFRLDAGGNLSFGADVDGTWYANGFWSAAFIRSNESGDYLKEADIRLPALPDTTAGATGAITASPPAYANGLDLNGNGSIGDIFVGGFIQLTPYDAQGNQAGASRMLSGKFFMELDPNQPSMPSHLSSYHGRLNADDYDSADISRFPTTGNGDPYAVETLRLNTMRYKNLGIFLMRHLNGTAAQQADPALGAAGIECDNFTDSNDNYIKDSGESPVTGFHCSLTLRLVTYDTLRNISLSGSLQDGNYGLKVTTARVKLLNF